MKLLKLLCLSVMLAACSPQMQVSSEKHKQNKVDGDSLGAADGRINEMIGPYKNKLDSQMNIRVMIASEDIKKGNPEGAMGNMVCDLLMRYKDHQKLQADFCVLNNGGLRIPVIYKGDVTVRTVFELMPFDNQLVLIRLKGSKCLELFQMIAAAEGVPVAGLRMVIEDGKATQVQIGGKDFNPDMDYWVLTSDYLANGGDKADAMKNPLERKDLKVLLRDVLIAEMKNGFYDGETLQAVMDGRITKK